MATASNFLKRLAEEEATKQTNSGIKTNTGKASDFLVNLAATEMEKQIKRASELMPQLMTDIQGLQVPTVAESIPKTSGGYYSRPVADTSNVESIQQRLDTLSMAMQYSAYPVESATKKVQAAEGTMKNAATTLETAYKAYTAAPTQETAEAYNQAVTVYKQAKTAYESAYSTYKTAYDEYQKTADSASQVFAAWKQYADESQASYDAWKGTIRDAETITREMAWVDERIAEAKKGDFFGLWSNSDEIKQWEERKALLQEEYDWAVHSDQIDIRSTPYFGSLSENDRLMVIDMTEINNLSEADKAKFENWLISKRNAPDDVVAWADAYGWDRLEELESSLRRYQNQQGAQETVRKAQEAADGIWGGIWTSLAARGANLWNAITSPFTVAQELLWYDDRYGNLDPNAEGFRASLWAGTAQDTVAKNIAGDQYDENGNKISDGGIAREGLSMLYGAGMSAADNLARLGIGLVTGGGGTVTLGLAAMGSFGDTVRQISEQGGDPMQALAMGVISGGLEVLTEKYSVENILKVAKGDPLNFKNTLKEMLKQGAVEVSEEEINFLASTLAEAAIMQDKSSYNLQVQELMAKGMSEEEARNQANLTLIQEAGETAVQSFLSGGMMTGAVNTVNNFIRFSNLGQKLGLGDVTQELAQEIIDSGLESAESTEAYQMAQNLQKKLDAGKVPTKSKLAQQLIANEQAIQMEKYGIDNTKNMPWSEQVEGALYGKNNIRRNDTLIACSPADTLVADAVKNIPLAIPQSILTKAQKGKDISHSIKKGKLAKLDEGIKKAPIAILNPERNAIVYVTNIKQGGLPIVASFDMENQFDEDYVHKATSIHLQVDVGALLSSLPKSATIYAQKNELDRVVGATNNLRGLAAQIKFVDEAESSTTRGVTDTGSLASSKDTASTSIIDQGGGIVNTNNQNGGTENANTYGQAGTDSTAGAGVLHGSGQWNAGAGTGEQSGGMDSSTEETARRTKAYSGASRVETAITRKNLARALNLPKVSAQDIGLTKGAENRNLRVLPQENWDDELQALAQKAYEETGLETVFVVGDIYVRGEDRNNHRVRAAITDTQIILQADYMKVSTEQILDHEIYHYKAADIRERGHNLDNMNQLAIFDRFSSEEWMSVLDAYLEALGGQYGLDEARSQEAYNEIVALIKQEVLADAYAGINAFGAGANKFTEAVQERTSGVKFTKQTAQENGVRQTNGPNSVRYSVADGKITKESTEEERYEILRDVELEIANPHLDRISDIDLQDYNTRRKSDVEPGLKALAKKLGITNVDLKNSHIDFPFQFSGKGLHISLHHQLEYGGTYQDYVLAMSCFDELIENAVPIEVHGEKKVGTKKENTDLKQTIVLVSAFQNGKSVTPVEMEVKEYVSRDSKLYMTVVLTKIEPEVLETSDNSYAEDPSPLVPGPTISLQDVFSNVNPGDKRFLKYVPDGFLNKEQKQAKQAALDEQKKEYEGYGKKDADTGNGEEWVSWENFSMAEVVQAQVEGRYDNETRMVRVPKPAETTDTKKENSQAVEKAKAEKSKFSVDDTSAMEQELEMRQSQSFQDRLMEDGVRQTNGPNAKQNSSEAYKNTDFAEREARIAEILGSVSINHAAQFERYTQLTKENPEQAAKEGEELSQGIYGELFDEYRKLTEQRNQEVDHPRQERYSMDDADYTGYSMTEDGVIYSYDFLTAQPDMVAVKLPDVSMIRNAEGKIDTGTVVAEGMKNARSVGTERAGKVFVRNRYTGRDLRIDVSSIRHSLNGGLNRLLTNGRLGCVIGDVVCNAIPINALQNEADGVSGTYAMAGYATEKNGRAFVAIITVEQHDGSVSGVETVDVTHAVSGRIKRSKQVDTKSAEGHPYSGEYSSMLASRISIADFLPVVKETYRSILSENVISALGEAKNQDGYYAGRVRYSTDDSDTEEKWTPKSDKQYMLDEDEYYRLKAEMDARDKEWRENFLYNELGEEGVKKYKAAQQAENARKNAELAQRNKGSRNTGKEVELDVEIRATKAKKILRKNLLNEFSIPDGKRGELGAYIDGLADRIVKHGALTETDRAALFRRMYEAGAVTIPADDYYAEARSYVKGSHIYVPDSVVADFGDDWQDVRRRAFAAGIYLTYDRTDKNGHSVSGIDVWNSDLAADLPGLFHADDTDRVSILEKIIHVAEMGKDDHISLAEYVARVAKEEYTSEDDVLDTLERQMVWALKSFAETAQVEVQLKERNLRRVLRERQENMERAQRAKERRELQELQQKTLKSLQWLNKNRRLAPEELREEWDKAISDIDLYAVGAANELNWSNKYQATWKDLAQMYEDARNSDPNFHEDAEIERIISRLDDQKIEDMDPAALLDLYKLAVGLRTAFYNRNNVINDEQFRIFDEMYSDVKEELTEAGKRSKGTAAIADRFFSLEQLSAMNVLERMAGWNPNSAWYSMARQLERGERDVRAFTVKANRMLEDFLNEHKDWVMNADGQGKDAIWYTIEVPELTEWGEGNKPIFGDTVTVYMTPAQKVHMYLESKNLDNLRHMEGGRTFVVDKELYGQGKRQEALATGRTIRMAPETVKRLVSDLTEEEMELAKVLDQYYNSFATGEINRVSNILYGYDKAMGKHYAPIYTNQNYTNAEFGVFDTTAEGAGNLKGRVQYSKNPSYNISAFGAFERNMSQAARFVGMAIPLRNWTTLMNWQGSKNSTKDVIDHAWGLDHHEYISDLLTDLQGGKIKQQDIINETAEKLLSNHISSVFGANPGIVLKQLGSIPLAGAYLGAGNRPSKLQRIFIDRELISKYTQDLAWRSLGYSMPETKQLKDHPNWTQNNKVVRFAIGGGAITAMDTWAASVLWPWAENKVRKEHPDLEVGTQEQIDKGESPFYKKVAEEFETAVARSQSTSDQMHQGRLRKSKNTVTRMFTMFTSDSAQTYNTLRQMIGEAGYYKKTGQEKNYRKMRRAVGVTVMALVLNALWGEAVNLLAALIKNKGKRYRDDDGEMTAVSVLEQMLMGMVSSISGTVIGGDTLAEMIGSKFTDEKFYGPESMEVSVFQDMWATLDTAKTNFVKLITDVADVAWNGGNVGEYFQQNWRNMLGQVKDTALEIASYWGIPAANLEAWVIGALKFIPGFGAVYDGWFESADKAALGGLTGENLEIRTDSLLDLRGIDASAETAGALAELYEAGYTGAVPSDVPSSITIGEETHPLNAAQQQLYGQVWADVVNGALDTVVASDRFAEASPEIREKMLKKLYAHAAEQAKAEMFDGYEPGGTAEDIAAYEEAGMDIADYFAVKAEGYNTDKYLKAVVNGLPEEQTDSLMEGIEELEPVAEGENVQSVQKWRMCVDLYGNPAFQLAALATYMNDSQFKKAETAERFDVDLGSYVKLYEIRAEYDENGNKSFSNAEYKKAIDSLHLSTHDSAVLWQLATGAKSAKNNPYNATIGQKVIDALAD